MKRTCELQGQDSENVRKDPTFDPVIKYRIKLYLIFKCMTDSPLAYKSIEIVEAKDSQSFACTIHVSHNHT